MVVTFSEKFNQIMSKTAIVTGASRGIGYELSKALAEEGHHVLAVARSAGSLEKLQAHEPKHIDIMPLDLTNADSIGKLKKEAENLCGKVDILVNNAGALVNKPFEDLNRKDWQHLLEVNLMAPVELVKSLLPLFSGDAHIVNISSMGGYQGSSKFPGLSAYSVAKGGLSILGECLAAEFTDRGIRVNTLCLGAVQTEMFEEAFPGFEAPVDSSEMGTYVAQFALEGSRFYNGQILPVTLGDPG